MPKFKIELECEDQNEMELMILVHSKLRKLTLEQVYWLLEVISKGVNANSLAEECEDMVGGDRMGAAWREHLHDPSPRDESGVRLYHPGFAGGDLLQWAKFVEWWFHEGRFAKRGGGAS